MGMGYLAQEPSVFRRLTVAENVLAILETLPLSDSERQVRLKRLLEELKISHLASQKAYTLSGGERRRLEITRALVTDPSLILLDEPFSGVDPLAVYDVQQIVMELRSRGLGILITDHNVRETLAVVDRAYLLCEGKVLREGNSQFLIDDPVSRELYLGPRFSM
jgi:lipopolysaccharide export system ATP-binding protein